MDRLRGRASRERRLRRRPPPRWVRAERVGRGLQPGLPLRGPPAAPRVRRGGRVGLDRRRIACVLVATARGDRRRADGGTPLPADTDPLPASPDRRARRPVRHRRRDVLRPVTDRDERRLRRPVHHRRLHAVRRHLDGLVEGPGGVLDRHARHRCLARAGIGEQVGGGLRDRRAHPFDPCPQCARPGPCHPRDDRDHRRPRLHGHQRPAGRGGRRPGLRQHDVPADHDRADPAGRLRGGRPPRRLDR